MSIVKQVNVNKLKELRLQNKLTLEELSTFIGYKTPSGYHRIELGKVKLTAEQVALLADLYSVDMEYFFAN